MYKRKEGNLIIYFFNQSMANAQEEFKKRTLPKLYKIMLFEFIDNIVKENDLKLRSLNINRCTEPDENELYTHLSFELYPSSIDNQKGEDAIRNLWQQVTNLNIQDIFFFPNEGRRSLKGFNWQVKEEKGCMCLIKLEFSFWDVDKNILSDGKTKSSLHGDDNDHSDVRDKNTTVAKKVKDDEKEKLIAARKKLVIEDKKTMKKSDVRNDNEKKRIAARNIELQNNDNEKKRIAARNIELQKKVDRGQKDIIPNQKMKDGVTQDKRKKHGGSAAAAATQNVIAAAADAAQNERKRILAAAAAEKKTIIRNADQKKNIAVDMLQNERKKNDHEKGKKTQIEEESIHKKKKNEDKAPLLGKDVVIGWLKRLLKAENPLYDWAKKSYNQLLTSSKIELNDSKIPTSVFSRILPKKKMPYSFFKDLLREAHPKQFEKATNDNFKEAWSDNTNEKLELYRTNAKKAFEEQKNEISITISDFIQKNPVLMMFLILEADLNTEIRWSVIKKAIEFHFLRKEAPQVFKQAVRILERMKVNGVRLAELLPKEMINLVHVIKKETTQEKEKRIHLQKEAAFVTNLISPLKRKRDTEDKLLAPPKKKSRKNEQVQTSPGNLSLQTKEKENVRSDNIDRTLSIQRKAKENVRSELILDNISGEMDYGNSSSDDEILCDVIIDHSSVKEVDDEFEKILSDVDSKNPIHEKDPSTKKKEEEASSDDGNSASSSLNGITKEGESTKEGEDGEDEDSNSAERESEEGESESDEEESDEEEGEFNSDIHPDSSDEEEEVQLSKKDSGCVSPIRLEESMFD